MRTVIVERDAAVREKIAETLLKSGPQMQIAGMASNGRDGFMLISREQPDLVVMDVELPKMNGISMLRKLRREECGASVVILTAEENFEHARQAVELGADWYLKKPLKQAQLLRAVRQIARSMEIKRSETEFFTAENILTACVNGMLHPDENFNRMTELRFGFTAEQPGAVFAVWLGSRYEEGKNTVRGILERAGVTEENGCYILFVGVWQLVLAVMCGDRADGPGRETAGKDVYLEKNVIPVLCGSIQGEMVCIWFEMERILELSDILRKIQGISHWNLLFDRGELIRYREAGAVKTVPLKYPGELEDRVRQAVLSANGEEIKKCYYRLYDILRREMHDPTEMKECLIRFNMAVVNAYKMHHIIGSELEIQRCMQEILAAVSWRQIRAAMEKFMQSLNFDAFLEEEDEQLTPLVRKALQLVRKYYDQGITLEEIANILFVSEEYLSTQFKKETGTGFTETVKRFRINRIRELLLGTRLKLNQIAELTGYSDPKYMSRVFKEETGMLPSEFRKSVL